MNPPRITVWCEFWTGCIIGPFFFENATNAKVNGALYRNIIIQISSIIPEVCEATVVCNSRASFTEVSFFVFFFIIFVIFCNPQNFFTCIHVYQSNHIFFCPLHRWAKPNYCLSCFSV